MKTRKDPRHQARRLALVTLYNDKLSHESQNRDNLQEMSKESLYINKFNQDLYNTITEGVRNELDAINQIISKHTVDWDINNIFKVDLTVLQMAIWEITNDNAPMKVVLDEAIELSKEFGSAESSKFINGVLAGIVNQQDDQEKTKEEITKTKK